jgi:hypothetical protein
MPYTYAAETVPEEVMEDLLNDYWPKISEFPRPVIIVKNDAEDPFSRVDIRTSDAIVISSDSPENIKYRGNIHYYDKAYTLTLEFRSSKDRQRVRDIWRIIRAICFTRKWNFTGYQLIRMTNYQEFTNDSLNMWKGVMKIVVEAAGVSVEAL